MSERALSVSLSDEAIEAIADRVAEVLASRSEEPSRGLGWREAAEHLHCKPQRIYALVHQRRLSPRRDGARLLFRRSELDAWLATGGLSQPSRRSTVGIRNGR